MSSTYFYAKGRRKTSVATVRLYKGKGESIINTKSALDYVNTEMDLKNLIEPITLIGAKPEDYYFTVKVFGGGSNSQIDAIKLGLARALIKEDPEFRPILKSKGLLKRDPRMVERKKPGLRKARRAEQYSKR